MKQTLLIILLVITFGIIAYDHLSKPVTVSAQSGETGRYQIISSPFSVWLRSGGTSTETSVFKIDTQTGEVWHYATGQTATSKVDGWLPIKNEP